jgi:RNA polymerase-binding protein DksA
VAKKKPGKKKTAKKKSTRATAARSARPAKKAAARTKPARKKAPRKKKAKSARATKAKAARPSSAKKKKTALKQSSAVKKKPAATSAAKSKSPPTKAKPPAPNAKAAAPVAKSTKVAAKAAKAPAKGGKKGAGKAPLVPDAQGYVIINGRRVRMISMKGLTIPKRTAASTAAAEADAAEKAPKKVRKSRLTPKDLDHFRELLLLHRRQLAGDLTSMESEALKSDGGNSSHMPIHMADIGSDTFDQDFMLGLAASERTLLKEIDSALMRIESGEYGICALTGNPIPKARLNAKPWAKYTVEAARMIERGLAAS